MNYIPKHNEILLLTYAGSIACGLDTDSSDVDLMGIAIPPAHVREGLTFSWDQLEDKAFFPQFLKLGTINTLHKTQAKANGLEGNIYNLKKYMLLAAKCNPTILIPMFCDQQHVILENHNGNRLRHNRDEFLSLMAYKSFTGYALTQLKRIRGHKKWLDNPPSRPDRKALGLPTDHKLLNKEQLKSLITLSAQQMMDLGISQKLVELILAEQKYMRDMQTWKQFETWRENRNPTRAALEAKGGYDTKHAMHLVRLMTMGEEIVKYQTVNVNREGIDNKFLLDIRNGLWDYDQLIEWAEKKQKEIDEFVDSGKCTLPKEPNWNALEVLYTDLINS